MMKNPGSLQKKVWLLREQTMVGNKRILCPVKVFSTKERCFKTYPGNWEKKSPILYLLALYEEEEYDNNTICLWLDEMDFDDETI